METAEVFASVRALSDHELLDSLSSTVGRHCAATADMLAHLAEVDARRLYLGQACSSMFAFCVERLHMSEPAAYRRIHAARTVRRFPALLPMVASGELHLSAIKLLTPYLTDDNQEALLAAARRASKRDIEQMLARRFPGTPPKDSIRRAQVRPVLANARHRAAANAPCATEGASDRPTERGCPPGPGHTPDLFDTVSRPDPPEEREESYSISFTASRALRDKVLQARDLLRHSHPDGDLAAVFERAMDLLLEDLHRKRFGRRKRRAKARDGTVATDRGPTTALGSPREPEVAETEPTPRCVGEQCSRDNPQEPTAATATTSELSSEASAETTRTRATDAGRATGAPEPEARGEATRSRAANADRARGAPVPEVSPGGPARVRSRHIPTDVKRMVIERDGLRCMYVDEAGRQCTATGFLELHHAEPFAKGGGHSVENIAVHCSAHNGYAAELDFGGSGPRRRRAPPGGVD